MDVVDVMFCVVEKSLVNVTRGVLSVRHGAHVLVKRVVPPSSTVFRVALVRAEIYMHLYQMRSSPAQCAEGQSARLFLEHLVLE